MQPFLPNEHPNPGSSSAAHARATSLLSNSVPAPASIELRQAQRAFASLIDTRDAAGEFRAAQLRSGAARTLSTLSADDRARVSGWLSLLLATHARQDDEAMIALIARIDARLAAHVRRALPDVVDALSRRVANAGVVAA